MSMQRPGQPVSAHQSLRTAVVLALLGLPLFSPASRTDPDWWEVVLTLKADGEYRLEGGPTVCSGRYAFAIRWTGGMEKDEDDFLLYRLNCELFSWEAGETTSSPEAQSVLSTRDFKEKPAFQMKYILRQGRELRLDFVVQGISVPQAGAEDAFPLLFPASEENHQRGPQGSYNAGVTKGVNRVALEEAEIYAGPVAKNFAWRWRQEQWQLKERGNVLTFQSHEARVEVRIIPRFSAPQHADT
jgi:hypothetical protein